jgi:hypothetical protein
LRRKVQTSRALMSTVAFGSSSSVGCRFLENGRGRSPCDSPGGASAVQSSEKPCLCAGMRRTRTSLPGLCLVGLAELPTSWLPHFSCARRLLAERMINIVAHFRTEVVKFIFSGRNSGQSANIRRKGDSRCGIQPVSAPKTTILRFGRPEEMSGPRVFPYPP